MGYTILTGSKYRREKIAQRESMAIEPDMILNTQSTVPVMKDAPKRLFPIYSSLSQKPQIIRAPKHTNKAVSSFLVPPSNVPEGRGRKSFEVYNPLLEKSKRKKTEQRVSPTLERFYQARKLVRRKRDNELPFPNMIPPPQNVLVPRRDKRSQGKDLGNSRGEVRLEEWRSEPRNVDETIPYDKRFDLDGTPRVPMPSYCTLYREEKIAAYPTKQSALKRVKDRTKTRAAVKGGSKVTIPNEQLAKALFAILELKVDNGMPRQTAIHNPYIVEVENDTTRDGLRSVFSEQINVLNYESDAVSKTGDMTLRNSYSSVSTWGTNDSRRNIKYSNSIEHLLQRVIPDVNVRKDDAMKSKRTKYSWEDICNWVPPSQRRRDARDKGETSLECKIKYSWQVIGMASQTSRILLDDLLRENAQVYDRSEDAYRCGRKYSWQIIGRSTQTLDDPRQADYWNGKLLIPNAYQSGLESRNSKQTIARKNGKDYIILHNQCTQTIATKKNQTDFTNCQAKFSWENLTKRYL